MADNTTIAAVTGQEVVATDDIAGVKYQRVKLSIGADGTAGDLHAGNPMPVAGTVTVGGTALVQEPGTFAYSAGTAGTVVVPSGALVRSISVYASSTGTASAQIFGGSVIPLAIGAGFDEPIHGALAGPGTVVFANSASYFVGWVT